MPRCTVAAHCLRMNKPSKIFGMENRGKEEKKNHVTYNTLVNGIITRWYWDREPARSLNMQIGAHRIYNLPAVTSECITRRQQIEKSNKPANRRKQRQTGKRTRVKNSNRVPAWYWYANTWSLVLWASWKLRRISNVNQCKSTKYTIALRFVARETSIVYQAPAFSSLSDREKSQRN